MCVPCGTVNSPAEVDALVDFHPQPSSAAVEDAEAGVMSLATAASCCQQACNVPRHLFDVTRSARVEEWRSME